MWTFYPRNMRVRIAVRPGGCYSGVKLPGGGKIGLLLFRCHTVLHLLDIQALKMPKCGNCNKKLNGLLGLHVSA